LCLVNIESMEDIHIKTLADLPGAAKSIIAKLSEKRKVFFYGEVGAGKTTLIKEICKQLQLEDEITSPTYPIINQYSWTVEGDARSLNHIDLYRLNDIEEALSLGIEDYLEDDSYCFIEWPALIEPIVGDDLLKIKILHNEDSSRKILFL